MSARETRAPLDLDAIERQFEGFPAPTVKALVAEVRRLRAVVAALPVNRDGEPILPGSVVVCPHGHAVVLPLVQRPYCTKGQCWTGSPGGSGGTTYAFDEVRILPPEYAP